MGLMATQAQRQSRQHIPTAATKMRSPWEFWDSRQVRGLKNPPRAEARAEDPGQEHTGQHVGKVGPRDAVLAYSTHVFPWPATPSHAHISHEARLSSRDCRGWGAGKGRAGSSAHRALVRLLARVPAHVHHQHVLRLEGLLLPRAGLPAAHELLLLPVDVLIVDVLPGRSAGTAVSPATRRCGPHLAVQTPRPTRPPPVCQATPPHQLPLAATNCRPTVCYSSQRHFPSSQ